MDAITNAAKLISHATGTSGVVPILELLGFDAPVLPLDDAARCELGLPESVKSASISRGTGAVRALVVEVEGAATTREVVLHLSRSLASRVPHLLWVVFTVQRTLAEFSIACWQDTERRPRVVALIAATGRILDSDADTLCALAAARSASDILTHIRWIELLGREAITRRFFRTLREVVDDIAPQLPPPMTGVERRELALLTISRLLFLSFLETKGWLAGDFDFLANQFGRCMAGGGGYHRRVLHPLFFGTLNTRMARRADRARVFGKIPFLNGGLFTRTFLESTFPHAGFADEAFSEVFSRILTSFRFSSREDSGLWSETAIDPEILGKSFEALMASTERKAEGAFYTPQKLVEHVTESALVAALSPAVDHVVLRALLSEGDTPDPGSRGVLLTRIQTLRILDPACGSGAFLVHALERLAELRLRLGETGTSASIRRRTLAASIFGVDINQMAVWLCQLRLWLAIVIDSTDPDPMHVLPLPNLDRQIRVGDSLLGGALVPRMGDTRGKRFAVLRNRYTRAVGARKKGLAIQLDRAERQGAIDDLERQRLQLRQKRRELVIAARSPDLFGQRATGARTFDGLRALRATERAAASRVRRLKAGAAMPFSFNVHFADVAADGGFDLVIGNPPWVRIHHINAQARAELQGLYESFEQGGWREGAKLAGSGRAFANQVDLASLFIERSIFLAREGGGVALLVPAKIWRSLSGGGVRSIVTCNLDLVALEDMTESRSGFDAAVYPSLIVGRRFNPGAAREQRPFAAAVHRKGSVLQWEMRADQLPLDHTRGSPWLLLPDQVRAAFEKLGSSGISLATSQFGRPVLGVKTGCNAAFIVEDTEAAPGIEREFLRPIVRGETLSPWRMRKNSERIIWTHGKDGAPLRNLPPAILARLTKWRATLERRTDNHNSKLWWSLHRTDGVDSRQWRVIWCDFGKSPRALVAPSGSDLIPLNTCYVARCRSRDDALALMVLINGPLLSAWLNAIAGIKRRGSGTSALSG